MTLFDPPGEWGDDDPDEDDAVVEAFLDLLRSISFRPMPWRRCEDVPVGEYL